MNSTTTAGSAGSAKRFRSWQKLVNTCEDGNDNDVYTKEIEYTELPIGGCTLWLINNTILNLWIWQVMQRR
jgi:hypothetical protein